jgi:hydroxymethylbilane synthase
MSAIRIATRGSALALAQANMVLAQCRSAAPHVQFEITIIKTTGDKLQTAALAPEAKSLPKGLFTKELEIALLKDKADLAVHSLKDLPTELPAGLRLGAVSKRADVRDVMIYRQPQPASALRRLAGRAFEPNLKIQDLPDGAVVATSSTRRRAQLLAINPGLKAPDIRGNVLTRIKKLAEQPELDATLLALAGISRLGYRITPQGKLEGQDIPAGLLATILDIDVMLPCVGQGAIGIEVRQNDDVVAPVCQALNDVSTFQCVTAERAFLAGMGGGCQSPVAAFAEPDHGALRMRAVSFASGPLRRGEAVRPMTEAVQLGQQLALELRP